MTADNFINQTETIVDETRRQIEQLDEEEPEEEEEETKSLIDPRKLSALRKMTPFNQCMFLMNCDELATFEYYHALSNNEQNAISMIRQFSGKSLFHTPCVMSHTPEFKDVCTFVNASVNEQAVLLKRVNSFEFCSLVKRLTSVKQSKLQRYCDQLNSDFFYKYDVAEQVSFLRQVERKDWYIESLFAGTDSEKERAGTLLKYLTCETIQF
jgi:hypothetical protein